MKKITFLILLIFQSITLLGEDFFTIEKQKFKVKKIHHLNNDTVQITLNNHLTINSENNNIYNIYKKQNSEKEIKNNYDIICNKKTGAIVEFISGRNSIINDVKIPDGVIVKLKHNSLAWIVDREIVVSEMKLTSLADPRIVDFKGIGFNVYKTQKYSFKMKHDIIQGVLSDAPLEKYNCMWENGGEGKNYGIRLSKDKEIVSAKLFKGTVYGFSEKLIYVFNKPISHFMPALSKIVNDDDIQFYGHSSIDNDIKVRRPIIWNKIPLAIGDKLYIINSNKQISYKLEFRNPKKISLQHNNNIEVVTSKSPLYYYMNLNPQSFVLNKSYRFKSNNKYYNFKKGSQIVLYENGKIMEAVLAKEQKVDIWGKKVLLQRNTTLFFKEDSSIESVTTENTRGKTVIYYIPQFEKK